VESWKFDGGLNILLSYYWVWEGGGWKGEPDEKLIEGVAI
jgi:hypothetical protein